jgi:hypothetical protein
MKRFAGPVLLSLLILLVLGACSQNAVGIFASIARERLVIDDRDLANDITVGAITRAGSRYFMASGPLRYRDLDDPAELANQNPSQWAVVEAPGANYTTTSVVAFGGAIYAAFYQQSGSPSGVYRITDPAASSPSLTGPLTISDTVDRVGKLIVAGGQLFLIAEIGLSRALFHWTGSQFDRVPADSGATDLEPNSWIDVASNGTDFLYLASGKAIFDAGGIGAGADAVDIDSPVNQTNKGPSAAFRAAHWDGTAFWLSDDSGHLYSSADGSSWTRNATAFTYDIDPDQEIGFTDFATVQNTVTSVTVVGTESAGYYVVGADASETPTSPAVSGSNYRESDLSGLAVTTFYADTTLRTDYPVPTAAGDPYELLDGYLLFAGTANGGLWRALFHDGATQWVRE